MISFHLRCSNGHEFDGWFASSDAFEKQRAAGLLTCAHCGDSNVERALMAPAVQTSRGRSRNAPVEAEVLPPAPASEAPAPPPALAEEAAKLVKMMRELKAAMKQHGTDVGERFPEEARRMHYGETEAKGIYGKASADEAKALIDEGVDVLPLPILPDEMN